MSKKLPEIKFPNPSLADEQGLLAVGGNLSVENLRKAYRSGIFPWYEEGEPILWWSPDPRMVLFPEDLKVSKSMRPYFNQQKFTVTYNQCFEEVMRNCATKKRHDQNGTWITEEMVSAYLKLHRAGEALSVEVWQGEKLVGGLYGIYLKEEQVFCGESMFSHVNNASKFGFISLVRQLKKDGVKLIDCQIHTPHLESLGAKEIAREAFLSYL